MHETALRYYDVRRRWKRVEPHLADEELNRILRRDFGRYTIGGASGTMTPSHSAASRSRRGRRLSSRWGRGHGRAP
jgi:hypothetical protein